MRQTETTDRRPLWKEPLLHFLLIGALLYGVDTWRQSGSPSSPYGPGGDLEPIVISAGQVEAARKRAESRIPANDEGEEKTRQKRDNFVDDTLQQQIRREVLVREARRMGLHKGDTIVRRRLVQKMEFLLEDLADVPEPTDEQLREWIAEHPDRYRRPATVTLRHVFFSDERDGAQRAARRALADGISPEQSDLGDAFAHGAHLTSQPRTALTQKFGRGFARLVMDRAEARADSLPTDWFGPIESAFGYHLVRLEEFTAASLPPLEEVRGPVRSAYLKSKRREAGERAIRRLVEEYPIRIEGVTETETATEIEGGDGE